MSQTKWIGLLDTVREERNRPLTICERIETLLPSFLTKLMEQGAPQAALDLPEVAEHLLTCTECALKFADTLEIAVEAINDNPCETLPQDDERWQKLALDLEQSIICRGYRINLDTTDNFAAFVFDRPSDYWAVGKAKAHVAECPHCGDTARLRMLIDYVPDPDKPGEIISRLKLRTIRRLREEKERIKN